MANEKQKAIDGKTVKYVAALSRISLEEEEVRRYGKELADILGYINKLKELDTSNTPPTSHPLDSLKNVFRRDVVKKSLSAEDALKNAPLKKDNFFSVPKILD